MGRQQQHDWGHQQVDGVLQHLRPQDEPGQLPHVRLQEGERGLCPDPRVGHQGAAGHHQQGRPVSVTAHGQPEDIEDIARREEEVS